MNAQQLRNSILQQAIQGKLVPQDPTDEPASVLLQRIRKEKERLVKEGKLKKKDLESKPIAEDEIPFEIPENWEWVRFGTITINRDCERIPLSVDERSKLKKKYDYYGASGVIDKVDRFLFNKPLLLIGEDGANLINRSTPIAFIAKGEYWVNNHAHVLDYCDEDLMQYVCWYINSISLVEYVTGTAQPKMNQEKMNSILVALPPLAEQRRIVAKIEELMPLVERYGKAQQALDQLNESLPARLRQSILQEAIQGRLVPQDPKEEPASELLKCIRKEKEQLVKEGKLKKKDLESKPIEEDEIPFEIPEGWEWCHFGEIVNMQMGKTPPRGDASYWENGTDSWVSISDMKDYVHITKTKEKISKYAAENAFRRKSPVGTLIMSFKLTVGRTSILDIPAYHNEAIISIFPYCDLNNSFRDYLFYLLPLLANLGDSKDAIKGKTLNSNSLYNLLIPLPPLPEQKRIVAKIEELFWVIK